MRGASHALDVPLDKRVPRNETEYKFFGQKERGIQ